MPELKAPRFVFRPVCAAAPSPFGAAAVLGTLLAQRPYHVIAHWKIGCGTGWDYLSIDSANQPLE